MSWVSHDLAVSRVGRESIEIRGYWGGYLWKRDIFLRGGRRGSTGGLRESEGGRR